jgi:hypothetical protein
MTMSEQDEPSTEAISTVAEHMGISLSDDEARELLNGVRRNRDMARQLRALVTRDSEPRPIFQALPRTEETRNA